MYYSQEVQRSSLLCSAESRWSDQGLTPRQTQALHRSILSQVEKMRTQQVQKEETVVLMHLFTFVLFDCKTNVQITSVYLTFVPPRQLPLHHTETCPSLL
jgi:hypothetical protein